MNTTQPRVCILTLIDPREEFYERMKKFSGADLMAVNKAMHGMVATEMKKRKTEIVSEQMVDSKEKVKSGVESMAENGAEALVLHVPGWTFPVLGALAARNAKMRGIPTLVYGSGGLSGPTAVKGAIDEIGVWNRAVYGQPVNPDVFDEMTGFAAAAACVNRLRGTTFGMFGGRAMGITTGIIDAAQWQKLFGVDVEHIDQLEIVRGAEEISADQIEKHFQWLKKNVKAIDEDGDTCTVEKLKKQIASYLAVRELVEKHALDFVGMKCQPELSDAYVNQCLGVAFLNDPYDADGPKATVPCSCEVDANSALTMQLLKLLSGGKPALFMDLLFNHPEEKVISCMNCGGASTWFAGASEVPEENLKEMSLVPHIHGKAGGAAIEYISPPADAVTWARLARKNGEYYMIIVKGGFVTGPKFSNPLRWPGCHIKINMDTNEFLKDYPSQHAQVVVGDYTRELELTCDILGIPYIRV